MKIKSSFIYFCVLCLLFGSLWWRLFCKIDALEKRMDVFFDDGIVSRNSSAEMKRRINMVPQLESRITSVEQGMAGLQNSMNSLSGSLDALSGKVDGLTPPPAPAP